jgi:hypothetical protein
MQKYPLSGNRRGGRIAQRQKSGYFHPFFKSKELWKILKRSAVLFLFVLSNHTGFSQTQTGATVSVILHFFPSSLPLFLDTPPPAKSTC